MNTSRALPCVFILPFYFFSIFFSANDSTDRSARRSERGRISAAGKTRNKTSPDVGEKGNSRLAAGWRKRVSTLQFTIERSTGSRAPLLPDLEREFHRGRWRVRGRLVRRGSLSRSRLEIFKVGRFFQLPVLSLSLDPEPEEARARRGSPRSRPPGPSFINIPQGAIKRTQRQRRRPRLGGLWTSRFYLYSGFAESSVAMRTPRRGSLGEAVAQKRDA